MTYLSDTARVVLAAAAQRDDLSVLPFPEDVKARGGAEQKVLAGLKNRGFVRVIETPGRPQRVVVTREGMAAIGVEPDHDETGLAEADTRAAAAECAPAGDTPAPAAEGASEATAGRRKAKAKTARVNSTKPEKAGADEKTTARAGTKQALMIELLKRSEGATVEQIAEATGWQLHTVRGAISGALKKKLRLTVAATRTRAVGPNKSGARVSSTVYRIVG